MFPTKNNDLLYALYIELLKSTKTELFPLISSPEHIQMMR